MITLSLAAQIACVRREIWRRSENTPDLLDKPKAAWEQTQSEQMLMVAVLNTLQQLQEACNSGAHVVIHVDDAESGCGLHPCA